MSIKKLRGGNSQLPTIKSIGDIIVLGNKDMFCWDGKIWQLIGARFLPQEIIDVFLSYISDGFPDQESMEWDLDFLINTYEILGKIREYYLPESMTSLSKEEKVEFCKNLVKKFINRVLEVSKLCEKNSIK